MDRSKSVSFDKELKCPRFSHIQKHSEISVRNNIKYERGSFSPSWYAADWK